MHYEHQTRVSIDELPRLLTWRTGLQSEEITLREFYHRLYARLLLWSRASQSSMFSRVTELPCTNQKRLLLAPIVSKLLRSSTSPDSSQINKFENYLEYEEFLSGLKSMPPLLSWSALGDRYSSPEGEYESRRIGETVLDPHSPHCHEGNLSELVEGSLMNPDENEIEMTERHLNEAFGFINSMNSDTAKFIKLATKVICLRELPNTPHRLYSASWRPMIGYTLLVNAHTDGLAPSALAERLIHEAIHSFLYATEVSCSLYANPQACFELRAVSPWSGRNLFLNTFVHACCVWFGLWSFWTLCPPEEQGVSALKERAERGFLRGSPISSLDKEAYECIQSDVRSAIDTMWRCVVSGSTDLLTVTYKEASLPETNLGINA